MGRQEIMSCFKYGISVALPAYKEAENLKVMLPKLKRVLADVPHEIIVIDTQRPMDDTKNICMQCGDIKYIHRKGGERYGDAVRTAFSKASFVYTVIMDADGSHNPNDILRMLSEIERSGCDLVIGSRYCKGGNSHNGILLKGMSWVLNCTYRVVFGLKVKDVSDSFRMYRTEEVKHLKLDCEDFDIVEEILIRLNEVVKNFKMVEIPIYFSKRQSGESKRELGRFVISYLKTMKRLYRVKKKCKRKNIK